MEFFCSGQILPAWSRWAWSHGRSPRSRSPHPPSITPAGRPSALVSTTQRTAGRPRMTPSGSGYRSVDVLPPRLLWIMEGRHAASSSLSLSSASLGFCCGVSALRLGCFQAETLLTSGLNIVPLICSTSLQITGALRKESQISRHAILTSRFSLDMFFSSFFSSFCKMWNSRELGLDTRESSFELLKVDKISIITGDTSFHSCICIEIFIHICAYVYIHCIRVVGALTLSYEFQQIERL